MEEKIKKTIEITQEEYYALIKENMKLKADEEVRLSTLKEVSNHKEFEPPKQEIKQDKKRKLFNKW